MKDMLEAMSAAFAGKAGWAPWDAIQECATDGESVMGRKEFRESMRAALSAALERGYRLVPVEPTEDMIDAAIHGSIASYSDVYRAMIAASPEVK